MIKRHSSRDAISIYQSDEKRVFRGKNPEIKEMGEGKRMKELREDYQNANIAFAYFNRASDII